MEQLQTLVETLELQNEQKKDFAVSTQNLTFVEGKLHILDSGGVITYNPTGIFHNQIADSLNVPRAYYAKMQEKGLALLDENVNYWLKREHKTKLVRTFNNELAPARAFLSDRYSIVDNYEVLFETLEAIKATGLHVDIVAAELSESKMYLKVVCPEAEIQAKKLLEKYVLAREVGDGVISGFVLQNSEIGLGKFSIAPRAVILACKNGLVNTKDALNKVHLGARMDELNFNENASVRAANLKLIKEQVKHAVKVFLSKKYLEQLVNVYTVLGEKEIEAPIANVIEVVSKDYQIDDTRKMNILNHFIKGGDSRRIGVINAITEEVQTLKDADLRNDGETACYDILKNFDKIEARAFKTKFTTN